jgi:hypothetical protein
MKWKLLQQFFNGLYCIELCQVKYNFYDDVAAVNDSGFSHSGSLSWGRERPEIIWWWNFYRNFDALLVFSSEVKALKNLEYLIKCELFLNIPIKLFMETLKNLKFIYFELKLKPSSKSNFFIQIYKKSMHLIFVYLVWKYIVSNSEFPKSNLHVIGINFLRKILCEFFDNILLLNYANENSIWKDETGILLSNFWKFRKESFLIVWAREAFEFMGFIKRFSEITRQNMNTQNY